MATATADPPAARRVPYDVDKHKLIIPVTVGDETVHVDGTQRHDWHLGVREPVAADEPPTPHALLWTRAGHAPQQVLILDGFQP